MIQVLKYVLLTVLVFMIYIVISTSLASNLYKEWDFLAAIPWMRATLWDFYANILLIYLWVIYKEKNVLVMLLWAVLFFCLGSIGTIGYVLIQLFITKPTDTIKDVLVQSKRDQ
ncbi:MAG TPA: DUF1475 family protein [Cytophagaceae bacterium]|jgi:hypothetical protein|nr:DUF1475 family protein [Cytophagaceae bacterium]